MDLTHYSENSNPDDFNNRTSITKTNSNENLESYIKQTTNAVNSITEHKSDFLTQTKEAMEVDSLQLDSVNKNFSQMERFNYSNKKQIKHLEYEQIQPLIQNFGKIVTRNVYIYHRIME